MYIQVDPARGSGIKESVYYSKAGVMTSRVQPESLPLFDPFQMELAVLQSEINFHAAQEQKDAQILQADAMVVNAISSHLAFSLPQLSVKQMQHVLFVKQMFCAGEVGFEEYIEKMRNLFPDRMRNLPEAMIVQIEGNLKVA